MKLKDADIIIGKEYILDPKNNSQVGCSKAYFKLFKNSKVMVIKKLNNFQSKNTVYIQAWNSTASPPNLINFWCSSYDLRETNEN